MAKQLARYDNYHSLANLSAGGTEALVLFRKGLENYPTVIDVTTGKEIARFGDFFVPDAMALSPDGMTAVMGRKKLMGDPREMGYEYDFIIWDVLGNQSTTIKVDDFEIHDILWANKSQFIVLTPAYGTIYDNNGNTVIPVFEVNGRGGHDIELSHNTDRQYAVYHDKQIHLFNFEFEKRIRTIAIGEILKPRIDGRYGASFAFSLDSINVAFVTHATPHAIALWDVPSNKLVTKLWGDADITAIEWLSDGYNEEKARQYHRALLLYAEFMKSEGKSRMMLWDISAGGSTEFVRVQGEVNRIIATQDKIIVSTNGVHKDDAIITVWDSKSLPFGGMPR